MSGSDAKIHTRRAMLSALGATALSTGAVYPVFGNPVEPATTATSAKTVPSFSALASDTTLQPGMFVETLGYFQPGDSGAAGYEIIKAPGKTTDEPIAKGLFARLLPAGYVSYRMFGARCDGQSDDGVAIKKAHQYANEARIPVLNLSGEFWLKETRLIPVQTNVNWGHTVFHIDEAHNTPREPHFEVLPVQKPS